MSTPPSHAPKRVMVVPPYEVAIRANAIDPAASVFLTANAGSGKTTILTRRVVRLLLTGVDPTRILCVTYTKAAAAEMQNRIFNELAAWVQLDDTALRIQILDLTGSAPDGREMSKARRLFARAIETPGGLKLQTIHAFAERLLHLFPFEANMPVRFTVMDDSDRADIMDIARRQMIAAATADPDSGLGRAFGEFALALDVEAFDRLILGALQLLRGPGERFVSPEESEAALRRILSLEAGDSAESVAAEMLCGGFPRSEWPAAIAEIRAGSTNDQKLADEWHRATLHSDELAMANAYAAIFFTKTPEKKTKKVKLRDKHLTAPTAKRLPVLNTALVQEGLRLGALLDKQARVRTLVRSVHLMALAHDMMTRFTAAKRARSLVDFDDLIDRTVGLVSGSGADWVLRKLDAAIDHVLIDEAQDTNPRMWDIVSKLTEDFFAGEGARAGNRTIFAVGDEKQSIYSFQGAAPKAFAASRAKFKQQAAAVDAVFHDPSLRLSFRTVNDVLGAVDAVFSVEERFAGLSSQREPTTHETARAGAPGFVELWPLIAPPSGEAREPWEEVDAPGRASAQVQLASRIARHIREMIATSRFEDDGAPVRAGDVMILVQNRDAFFQAVIRALKRENVPVAGADRLKLHEQIGVLDLVAAARVAILIEDDLSLAAVLKSPLIGLDDQDLMRLAPNRTGSLYQALATSAATTPRHKAALVEVEAWRELAITETPFGFFSTILSARGGRKKLLARLGLDAVEAIDVFMAEVTRREAREAPSLAGFVEAFAAINSDVKRDQDAAGDAVRVLTVHGAKGLEARIVYLPDTVRMPNFKKDALLFERDGALLWSPTKAECPGLLADFNETAKATKFDEYRRLLYVAMTRARDRLYVAGWGNPEKTPPESWYGMIEAALGGLTEKLPSVFDGEDVRRFRKTSIGPVAVPTAHEPQPLETPLPDWVARAVPPEPVAAPVVRPSMVGVAADSRASADRIQANTIGDATHFLIEKLPASAVELRPAAAARLLAGFAPRLPIPIQAEIADRAMTLITSPACAELFGPHSRAEVDIAGTILLGGGPKSVVGRIDRLVILPDKVIAADIKSGRMATDGAAPFAYVTQLALYGALLEQLYPGRRIECQIVWTNGPEVQVLHDEARRLALDSITDV